jgi:hypothetical protein
MKVGEVVFVKIHISHFGCWKAHCYFPRDADKAKSFRESVFMLCWNLIEMLRESLREIALLEPEMFIFALPRPVMEKFSYAEYEQNPFNQFRR